MDTTETSTVAALAVRPLDIDDLASVTVLDRSYAERHACAPVADVAALRHYARGGHAFVAQRGDETRGAVLAHAVWDGARPAVRVVRLVARDDAYDVVDRLVGAVVKSAYDAAVYDLVIELPASDSVGREAVEANAFGAAPVLRFERVLGSRSADGS
jgi:hypothetical protein